MADHSVHFSSDSAEWNTPKDLFYRLNRTFHFSLDACADDNNALVRPNYFTANNSCLLQPWGGQRTFMNPPYARAEKACDLICKKKKCLKRGFHIKHNLPGTGDFVRKAYQEAQHGSLVVCLLPARTDQDWYHDFCKKGDIIKLRGRLHFNDGDGGAPFPSMIVIFRGLEEI